MFQLAAAYTTWPADEPPSALERSASRFRRSGTATGRAWLFGEHRLGRPEPRTLAGGEPWARGSVEVSADLDDREGQATNLTVVAMVESITARYDQSVDHLEQALALARVVGAVTQETSALQRMAIAELGRGDVDAALRRARQAADVSTRSLSALETAQAQLALGYAAAAAGLWQEARPAFAAAAEVTDTLELPTLAREARAGLAGVERSEGDLEAAVALVRAVVPHLDVKGLEGSVSPGRVLLDVLAGARRRRRPRGPRRRRACPHLPARSCGSRGGRRARSPVPRGPGPRRAAGDRALTVRGRMAP